MKKETTTEKYINKAIKKAKSELSGTAISHCNIQMHNEADGATGLLAEALLKQAEANMANSETIETLARSLKPIDICAIKITNDKLP